VPVLRLTMDMVGTHATLSSSLGGPHFLRYERRILDQRRNKANPGLPAGPHVSSNDRQRRMKPHLHDGVPKPRSLREFLAIWLGCADRVANTAHHEDSMMLPPCNSCVRTTKDLAKYFCRASCIKFPHVPQAEFLNKWSFVVVLNARLSLNLPY